MWQAGPPWAQTEQRRRAGSSKVREEPPCVTAMPPGIQKSGRQRPSVHLPVALPTAAMVSSQANTVNRRGLGEGLHLLSSRHPRERQATLALAAQLLGTALLHLSQDEMQAELHLLTAVISHSLAPEVNPTLFTPQRPHSDHANLPARLHKHRTSLTKSLLPSVPLKFCSHCLKCPPKSSTQLPLTLQNSLRWRIRQSLPRCHV